MEADSTSRDSRSSASFEVDASLETDMHDPATTIAGLSSREGDRSFESRAAHASTAVPPVIFKSYEPRKRGKYLRYSTRLRESVVRFLKSGRSNPEAAEVFQMPESTIRSIKRRYEKTKTVASLKRGGDHSSKLSEEQKQIVHSWLQDDCNLKLREISQRIHHEFGTHVSATTIGRTLAILHYSLKLNPVNPAHLITQETENKIHHQLEPFQPDLLEGSSMVIFLGQCTFNVSTRLKRDGDKIPLHRTRSGKKALLGSQLLPTNISTHVALSKTGYFLFDLVNFLHTPSFSLDFVAKLQENLKAKNIKGATLVFDETYRLSAQEIAVVLHNSGHKVQWLCMPLGFAKPSDIAFHTWRSHVQHPLVETIEQLRSRIENAHTMITPLQIQACFESYEKSISINHNQEPSIQ